MEKLHERCHETCSKAKILLGRGLPGSLQADAQRYVGDLEELLRTGSAASSADANQEQLILLTCSAMDLASLGMEVAFDLSDQVATVTNKNSDLTQRVDALEGGRELLLLRELSSQCENKLYRLCVKEVLRPHEVVHGTLARLMKDKRLDQPLLDQYLSDWTGLEGGLTALKEMGGLAIAHPQQGASPSREELISLVERHAGPLVMPDALQVIEVLVDAAGKLGEPLFVPTM